MIITKNVVVSRCVSSKEKKNKQTRKSVPFCFCRFSEIIHFGSTRRTEQRASPIQVHKTIHESFCATSYSQSEYAVERTTQPTLISLGLLFYHHAAQIVHSIQYNLRSSYPKRTIIYDRKRVVRQRSVSLRDTTASAIRARNRRVDLRTVIVDAAELHCL